MSDKKYGIYLLKGLAMFFIVIQHLLSQGGILTNPAVSKINYGIAWYIEIIAYVAVDCYALISGYLSWNKNHSVREYIKKYLSLWSVVALYSVTIQIIYPLACGTAISIPTVILSFFPVLSYKYWYFTAYTGVYFLTPILNKVIAVMDEKTSKYFAIVSCLLFCVTPIITPFFTSGEYTDIFSTRMGYSFLWLSIMYIYGGLICKYKIGDNVSKKKLFMYYIVVSITSWVLQLVTMTFPGAIKNFAYMSHGLFLKYVSPLTLLSTILLFLMLKDVNITEKWLQRITTSLGKSSFAVYLIHTHPLIYTKVLYNFFGDWNLSSALLIPSVIGFSAIIMLASWGIDIIRQQVWKIPKLFKKRGGALDQTL